MEITCRALHGSSPDLPVSLVRCSGGKEKRRGRASKERGCKLDPGERRGAETARRDGPFQVAPGKNWERGKASHPQKHLARDEPVVIRQCAHLFNQ